MKQPELGKKIAELLKAKGLTQEELVEKCNINVRTLHRIETGEASPRSYTIRIIFAALDFNIYDSSKSLTHRFMRIEFIVSKWLEQLYKYVLDLFNLKTHTMKKIAICTFFLFSYNSNVKAQSRQAIINKLDQASSNSMFMQMFNNGKIDSLSLLYLENGCMMPDQFQTINSRNEINDYYRQLYYQGLRFSHLESISKFIADSVAIDRGVWAISINSVVVVTGTYLTQWRYINEKWLIENEMSKSDVSIKEE